MIVTHKLLITVDMIRESLYSAVVCDALDSIGYCSQSPRIALPPLSVDGVLVGRCRTTAWSDVTVSKQNPYEFELKAVDACQPGDVLIAAADGDVRSGIWGELLSTAARNRGCVGAIVDGSVRDVAKLRSMKFPVFARGTSVYDSRNRQSVVDFDVPVQIAGVVFQPGDLVIADVDGVVVVPRAVEDKVMPLAWEKAHEENAMRNAILNGMKATAAYEKFGIL